MSIGGKVGTEGQVHSGCLDTKMFHVSALLGANTDDTSTWNALPKRSKRHGIIHQDVLRVPYMYVTKHTCTPTHMCIVVLPKSSSPKCTMSAILLCTSTQCPDINGLTPHPSVNRHFYWPTYLLKLHHNAPITYVYSFV